MSICHSDWIQIDQTQTPSTKRPFRGGRLLAALLRPSEALRPDRAYQLGNDIVVYESHL